MIQIREAYYGVSAKRKEYVNLDIAKFVCSLLIVFIHTSPFAEMSTIVDFYFKDVVARVAVPLYFAMSGFLFFRKLDYQDGKIKNSPENLRHLMKCVTRNLTVYLTWSVIYYAASIPEWYYSGWWGIYVIKDCVVKLFFTGSYYHLWYLLALIYAIPLLYILLCFISIRKIWLVAGLLWICECLIYSYTWIGTDRIELITMILQRAPILFDTLFRGIPLLAVGAVCGNKMDKNRRHQKEKILVSFVLCVLEASLLFFLSPNTSNYSYLFTTPLVACFGIQILTGNKQIQISAENARRLRNMSLTVYCIHPLVIIFCGVCSVPNGIPLWLAVSFLTIGLAYLYEKLRNNRRR